jgi:ATPase family associated with various cellular activities (AAA)
MLGRAPDARQALVLPSCSLNSRNRMARLPKPEDVFTPARPVSDDMFATRQYEHLQDRVEAALDEQGRQVVLFGLTGVGKTSLANYLCRNREIERIRIECGSPFEDMMREALGKVVGREEIEWIEKESAEIGIGATLAGLFNLGGKASLGAETKYARYPVSLATTAAEAFRLKGVRILFLDNFENLAAKEHYAETATEIVQMMKSFSDRAAEYGVDAPKVILAGIPKASEDLIKLDGATARRTAQIEVPRMPPSEIDQILVRGENKLGIEFAGLARDRIIQFSDGCCSSFPARPSALRS